MKKYLVFLLLPAAFTLQFCSSTKKSSSTSSTSTIAKTTFDGGLRPLISEKCSPCHTTGNKKKLDTFEGSKESVDDMIARIEKSPGEKGFMPFKHDKLTEEEISVFKKWKSDGLLEK